MFLAIAQLIRQKLLFFGAFLTAGPKGIQFNDDVSKTAHLELDF